MKPDVKPLPFVFVNGKITPLSKNAISIATHSFNYGTASFEGMKAYYDKRQKVWRLFRPDRHFARLQRGAELLGLRLQIDLTEFVDIISRLVRKNACKDDVYIRPIFFNDTIGIGLNKRAAGVLSIYLQKMPLKPMHAFSACMVTFRRPTDGSYGIKITGNYVLSKLAQREAYGRGYDIGILRSTAGYLSEASAMNLFFVEKHTVLTPSLSCGALEGVTRNTIIKLLQTEMGYRASEGKYRPARLARADEIFLTGTGSGVNGICRFEKRSLRNAKGGVAREIREIYVKLVRGGLPGFDNWLVPIQ
jgi:branched-chain amino acid aminotransferase